MAKNNKSCLNCGKRYSFCNNCSSDNSKPSWMNAFCSENCKDLFQTATDYFAGEITPAKAKAIVNKLDISNPNIKPSILRMVDELKDVAPEEIVEAEIQSENVITEEIKVEDVKSDSETTEEFVEASGDVEDVLGGIEAIPENPEKKFGKKNKKNRFDED